MIKNKLFLVLFLVITVFSAQICFVSAQFSLDKTITWQWGEENYLNSVAVGDVDGDGLMETVTAGEFSMYSPDYSDFSMSAQLCVWDTDSLILEKVKTWNWDVETHILSVAVGDVDGDGQMEIVSGGIYSDNGSGTSYIAQLCVWDGGSLALENVQTWQWGESTLIWSVAVGDVDGDGQMEIVTGGNIEAYRSYSIAQLCVWDGGSLALENVQTWQWDTETHISCVVLGEIDADGDVEIVTGGDFGTYNPFAQLCVWDGGSLALENVQTWRWELATFITSIALGNVDDDNNIEIITGGRYSTDLSMPAQLCVWDGDTLVLKNVQTWVWGFNTELNSIAIGDIDSDTQLELLTGSLCLSGAQMCVWSGNSLAIENVETWCWGDTTFLKSIVMLDVDNDDQMEIIVGSQFEIDYIYFAQLCVWDYS